MIFKKYDRNGTSDADIKAVKGASLGAHLQDPRFQKPVIGTNVRTRHRVGADHRWGRIRTRRPFRVANSRKTGIDDGLPPAVDPPNPSISVRPS
jgi:hypothetical protein